MSSDSSISDDEGGTEYCDRLGDLDPESPLSFDLYEKLGTEAAARQGQVKSYGVKEHGSAIYAEKTSDYSVSIQRLLWVDGHEKSRAGGGGDQGKEMTLVVLKLVVSSRDSNTKIEHMTATLELEDMKKKTGGNEPEVQAWAPFRTLEKWNSSAAQRETTASHEINLRGGYSGVELSARRGRESKISWDRTDFDSGQSTETISKVTGRRNGVTWFVKQNNLQNQGATPELWMSVLFSRPSSEAYRVKFTIDVRAGTMQAIENKTKRFFGLGPGQTSAFSVTPDMKKATACNFEGKEILKCIDLNNLGNLRGPNCSLNVTWGPQASLSAPDESDKPKMEMSHKKEEQMTERMETELRNTDVPVAPPFSGVNPLSQPGTLQPDQSFPRSSLPRPSSQPGQEGLPPLMIGWYSPNSGADAVRLANLESRLAQAEARIAAQDQILLQLQHAKTVKTENLG